MPFRLYAAVAVSLIICTPTFSAASMTIRVVPGPVDGAKVITPWGDYIVIAEGDSVWVGTAKEYTDAMARSAAASAGLREFCASRSIHCNSFIERDAPSVQVGHNEIAGVDLSILFGEHPNKALRRPAKPPQTEYVSIVWSQRNDREQMRALFVNTKTRQSYLPYECGTDLPFHHCEFIVARTGLIGSAALVFTSPHQLPGAIPAQSIAWMDYANISLHLREMKKARIDINKDPDDESYRYLAALHELDPAIPADGGS